MVDLHGRRQAEPGDGWLGRVLLKIVYVLTCRILSLVTVSFHGDQAVAAEVAVFRHDNAVAGRLAAGFGTSRRTGPGSLARSSHAGAGPGCSPSRPRLTSRAGYAESGEDRTLAGRRTESVITRYTEEPMKAIVVTNQAAEAAGITLAERPEPTPAINDVVVEVRASGFVPAEWEWPSTWVDRSGHDRVQAIIGHEFAGVVTSLGYGTTGLSLGQRVFGITDWHRDGTLAEYAAVEARNLAPLPGNVDFTTGASLPISGLTAWQGLFQHGRLQAGQSVLAHGAAGAVGSAVTQLARESGAYVIGTGRAADRQAALDFGANEFLNLDDEDLEDIGGVDLVFDVIGGDIQRRSASIIRPGGTLVSVVGPAEARPSDGLAVDFVVESIPSQLAEIVDRVRVGHLRTHIGTVATLDHAVPALNPAQRSKGKTVIRVRS